MSQKTKQVEVNGQLYQIRKLRANVGSFILTRILAAGISAASVGGKPTDDLLKAVFTAFLRGLDFDTFSFIQNNCLAAVSRMTDSGDGNLVPMPIVSDSGVFAVPEIADNLSLVMGLTVQSLLFNLSDFFDAGGLKVVMSPPMAA